MLYMHIFIYGLHTDNCMTKFIEKYRLWLILVCDVYLQVFFFSFFLKFILKREKRDGEVCLWITALAEQALRSELKLLNRLKKS